MLALAGLMGASFILVSLLVGGRLLLLGLQTGRKPELAVGLGLFSMGGVAWPLMVVAQQVGGLADGARAGLALLSIVLMGVGESSLAWFTWQVFRPQERWAKWLVVAIAVAFASCALGQALRPGYAAIARREELPWLFYRLLTILCLTWTGSESLHYARISARRQRIGLSDPAVTNRFVLWATCTLTCVLLSIVTTVVDPSLSNSLVGAAVTTPFALVAALALWFAFLPPDFYTRWLLRRPA